MARLFGTDGVRGLANDLLTPTLAVQLGEAAARVLTKDGPASGYCCRRKPSIQTPQTLYATAGPTVISAISQTCAEANAFRIDPHVERTANPSGRQIGRESCRERV